MGWKSNFSWVIGIFVDNLFIVNFSVFNIFHSFQINSSLLLKILSSSVISALKWYSSQWGPWSWSGSESYLSHLITRWSWTSYLTFLYLSFPSYKLSAGVKWAFGMVSGHRCLGSVIYSSQSDKTCHILLSDFSLKSVHHTHTHTHKCTCRLGPSK